MSSTVYLPDNNTHSSPPNTRNPWFETLPDSTLSTTRYLSDTYTDVVFKVVRQEERDGPIYRISGFMAGDRIIVHSVADIPVDENPPEFIDITRRRVVPIGKALLDNGYKAEWKIL